ncbi:MAG: dUTP diphosphatase [Candidatus Woesearchaeota archaeon]
MITLNVKKLHPQAIIPEFQRKGDAAVDLHTTQTITIEPQQRMAAPTGIATEFPSGYVALIKDRSGLALKNGIHTLGGVIDANYRGEIKVILHNTSHEAYTIQVGERIAQMILLQLPHISIQEVDELSDSNRGQLGFGSSGK